MIAVTILTKNAADTLRETLEALRLFSEVLILDTGSTDSTLDIAREYENVKVVSETFLGFGKTHNLATRLASHDWILSIDSDEVVTPELASTILNTPLEEQYVYSLDRHNYFNGKWIKCCSGWYPDPVVRLYNRKVTQFTIDDVHERVITDNLTIIPLRGKLFHTPYRSIESFLAKMQFYSTLFAEQNKGKKKSSLMTAIMHSLSAFIKNYIFKRGFLGGKEGFIISYYNAHTTYYKYLKLAFRNRSF